MSNVAICMTFHELAQVAGPRLWNNIPLDLCDSELTLSEFRRSICFPEDRGACD